jgi:hypothetical protein
MARGLRRVSPDNQSSWITPNNNKKKQAVAAAGE